ncbi:MAG: DNA adenine methylase [bacterium]|nr:DNA adenine methylase [bacterium]
MKQLSLPLYPNDPALTLKAANVASVPNRSPFRYPGGKTWLVPYIRQWLSSLKVRPPELVELFAGGGIVGLTAVFENYVDRVRFVERDAAVAAVWQTMLHPEHGRWLAEAIAAFDLTPENVDALLAQQSIPTHQQALQTIVRNRINRGGILAQGAGRIKHGENNRGLRSRWYPATLQKRILDIVHMRDRITFVHGDGLAVAEETAQRTDIVYFVDPPYTASEKKPGRRLYDHSVIDHYGLFAQLRRTAGDFLMTYDESEHVRDLAKSFGFAFAPVPMKTTHHARQHELLIGRNLDWLFPSS